MRCSGPAEGREGLFTCGAVGSTDMYQQELEEFAWEKGASDTGSRGSL